MRSLNGRDEIRRKIRELEDYLPKSPEEHDIRENNIRTLRISLDSLSRAHCGIRFKVSSLDGFVS